MTLRPDPAADRAIATRFHTFTAIMCVCEAFFAAEFAVVPYMAAVPNKRWWVITANATVFSVLGGVLFFGFGAGFASTFAGQVYWGYEVGSTPAFLNADLWSHWFQETRGWDLPPWALMAFVTFLAALLPVPYKLYGLAAGLSGFGFFNFLLVSILGKTLRHGIIFYAACKSLGWLGHWLHSRAGGPPKWLAWIKP